MEKCMFPEELHGKEPNCCSPEQQRKCHEKSGGVHPLPKEETEKKEETK